MAGRAPMPSLTGAIQKRVRALHIYVHAATHCRLLHGGFVNKRPLLLACGMQSSERLICIVL